MKVRNAQHKSTKLKLNKISIVNLTSVEMMYVHGGVQIVAGGNTGTNTLQTATTTRTVQSVAPSNPCTGEPGPYINTTVLLVGG